MATNNHTDETAEPTEAETGAEANPETGEGTEILVKSSGISDGGVVIGTSHVADKDGMPLCNARPVKQRAERGVYETREVKYPMGNLNLCDVCIRSLLANGYTSPDPIWNAVQEVTEEKLEVSVTVDGDQQFRGLVRHAADENARRPSFRLVVSGEDPSEWVYGVEREIAVAGGENDYVAKEGGCTGDPIGTVSDVTIVGGEE
jgi:hypothetical protein